MLEDAIEKLVTVVNRQDENAMLIASSLNNLADAIKNLQPQTVDTSASEAFEKMMQERVNLSVVSDLPSLPQPQKVALPSKMELAKEWLREHPEDRVKTGRELSASCFPHGVEISHVFWNKAKNP